MGRLRGGDVLPKPKTCRGASRPFRPFSPSRRRPTGRLYIGRRSARLQLVYKRVGFQPGAAGVHRHPDQRGSSAPQVGNLGLPTIVPEGTALLSQGDHSPLRQDAGITARPPLRVDLRPDLPELLGFSFIPVSSADPLARFVDVLPGGQVHHRVGAPADGPAELFDRSRLLEGRLWTSLRN